MAGETPLTIVGNLTADPELRFTPGGDAVANFTVASTPRVFDRQSGQWRDGEALFMRCSIWRQPAENVAESLIKGARVVVQGRLVQRSFTTRDGDKRTVIELEADEVAPSLRYATARVAKVGRQQGTGVSADNRYDQPQGQDPWAAPAQAGHRDQGGPADSSCPDAPPF